MSDQVRGMSSSLAPFPMMGLIICLALGACQNRSTLAEFGGQSMGTTYSVKVVDPPPSFEPDGFHADIDKVLRRINGQMSTYLEDSELSRFNASRNTDWLNVSSELVAVVRHAQRVSELTGGAFDVTVGPLVNLWGFGPEARSDEAPPADAIETALQRTGFRQLHVKDEPSALRKDNPGIYVDLSAIAKGYAVDQIAERLEKHGIDNYLVEIGGEVRGRGHNARGIPWQIAIEKPSSGERAVHQVIAVDGVGVATSGDYRNYFEQDGQHYSHTIDPRTGRPVTHSLASVTVISPSAMHADALATGLLVLGPEAGYALAEREALAVIFILRQQDDFVTKTSSSFERYSGGKPS